MAAGIGSRFGTGIKQLEPVDDAGHIIMDYSIHDAIEAGFNHVVFIIRKVLGVRPHKEKINISKEIINKTRGAEAPYAAQIFIHLSVVSSRQRLYGRLRCEDEMFD